MTGPRRILVVEDEPTIATVLKDDLELEGYAVEVVEDGLTGEQRARTGRFDLVLLDIMLPRKDGFAVCRSLRAAGVRTPIIMLTARGQEADKVQGLGLGADDYVTKPFSPRELVARIDAVLRRSEARPDAPDVWEHGALRVDFRGFTATRDGQPLSLTVTELKLLRVFVANPGRVFTIADLLDAVWGPGVFLTDRVVYTHVNNLRGKIETDASHPRLIVNVRGMGYRFDG